jgi:hypothetical protein
MFPILRQNLSTAQPRVGAHEAARAPLSLEKHEMPRTEKNLPGCETVGTSTFSATLGGPEAI